MKRTERKGEIFQLIQLLFSLSQFHIYGKIVVLNHENYTLGMWILNRGGRDKSKNEKLDTDIIENCSYFEEYCTKLDVDVAKKDGRIILSDISGDPPRLRFSLTIFKDFTISCYKGLTKVTHNDLINGFTYKDLLDLDDTDDEEKTNRTIER